VVDLLHKHFSSWLIIFCKSISILTLCTYTTMSKTNIMPCQQFICVLQVGLLHVISLQCRFFTWTCWCRFTFLTYVGKISQCCRRRNWMSHVIIWVMYSIHMSPMAGMTVTSPSASLQCQTSDHRSCTLHGVKLTVITYHLCQITLNQTLLYKFKKWCQLSRCIRAKSCKKESHKQIPACNWCLSCYSSEK
jgi:hypothetical protein